MLEAPKRGFDILVVLRVFALQLQPAVERIKLVDGIPGNRSEEFIRKNPVRPLHSIILKCCKCFVTECCDFDSLALLHSSSLKMARL